MENNLKLGRAIEGIETTLCSCLGVADASEMLEIARKCKLRFLDPRPNNPDRDDNAPQKKIGNDGSIFVVPVNFTHPALGRDCRFFSAGWQIPVANLSFESEKKAVCISQSNARGAETLEEMVSGQVAVAALLAPAFSANYGWIDVSSEHALPRTVSRFGDVKKWFYTNIFSQKLVAGAPDGFFKHIPAYAQKILPNGSLLVQSAATFTEWYENPATELTEYISKHAPKLSIFRT